MSRRFKTTGSSNHSVCTILSVCRDQNYSMVTVISQERADRTAVDENLTFSRQVILKRSTLYFLQRQSARLLSMHLCAFLGSVEPPHQLCQDHDQICLFCAPIFDFWSSCSSQENQSRAIHHHPLRPGVHRGLGDRPQDDCHERSQVSRFCFILNKY